MTHFLTVRLLEVEGTPKDVDLEGMAQKIPGHWKKHGRRLLENDEEALVQLIKRMRNTLRRSIKCC